MRKYVSILALVLVLLFTFTALAQESAVKGNVSGTVVDPSGAVVPNAKVTLSGPQGTRTATTDGSGRFYFDLLVPGAYSVKAEAQGFKTADVKGIQVFTNRNSNIQVKLEPGGASEVVEVSAAAVTVDTTSTAVSTNLNNDFYSRVPVARNVTGLFYASPGVTSGGGTGPANPSISGGSGLENQYVADGVNITDGAFGGIGVFSRVYGSLSTGINLSFVKEVQVKTAGYEPQYGKSTGGLVQIVTKSGGNDFHGGISGFFGPKAFESQRLNPDNFNRLNQTGLLLHDQGYDVAGEIGGYVPGLRNKLFFFGSFNPSWKTQFDRFATLHGAYNFPLVGTTNDLKQTFYNYAAKLTWKLSDKHQLESSVYGDPTRSNTGAFNTTSTFSDTTFSKLSNGTRNWVARYNGVLSPTWLANASFSWGHNYLTETPKAPNIYQILDVTGCGFTGTTGSTSCRTPLTPGTLDGPLGPLSGIFTRQGLGFSETTQGDNYGLNFDTQKTVDKLGSHTFGIGYHYERNFYKGNRSRSGPSFPITALMALDPNRGQGLDASAIGLVSDAAFQLRVTSATGAFCTSPAGACPTMFVPGAGIKSVYLRQTRGEFGKVPFDTDGNYHAAYVNDAWSPNRHVTMNIGWRWEQQRMQGTPYTDFRTGQKFHTHYTYTDNWSPRLGLSIDPLGDRKSKIYGNFARYSYAIPLDMAIRSLSNELDFGATAWLPVADASGNVALNPDGTLVNPILDDAHYVTAVSGASLSSTTSIAPGTKMQYLQEWMGGIEHEFPKGIVVDVRFIDRRLKRIVEDMAGISPEAFQCCLNQNYLISNPSAGTDLFINPIQVDYPAGGLPASCASGGTATDFAGNPVGDFCITNPATAGLLGADGKPDGFVNPVRIYRAVEFEVNKSFSAGWQMRTNYRWSELSGNYEGAFRNDNGQSDPSISSLFDFVRGDFGLLGDQFAVGWLNTDRRHIINSYLSYTFSSSFLKNLTLGTGVRVESGIPINDLRAHPAYQNSGEIPVGGRGSLGRTPTDGQADIHAEYGIKLTERQMLHLGTDLFNITNQRTQLRVDQNQDRSFLVSNADFLKPYQGTTGGLNPIVGFQRPFNARLFARWTF
ncbi:MAG TPA: TonB-dependent receptor [Terriglobales bacterium]|nr:TonB-dependent receptor [Terriglobales bacterium]